MKHTGFRGGLFWGAVFGALAGYMNAPQSGRDTREDIKNIIDATADDVDDIRYKFDNLLVAVNRLAKEGIEGSVEAVDGLQTSIQHFSEETSPRIKRIKRDLEQLTHSIEEAKTTFNS